jgi:sugar O-acyltransferase (sialic acid O-acetyltransferase NeuD family)
LNNTIKVKKFKPLIIIGSGGHATSVANVALSCGYKNIQFFDKTEKSNLLGFRIFDNFSQLSTMSDYDFIIAVGDNTKREAIYKGLIKKFINLSFVSLIHESATICSHSIIGLGTVVMPGVVVGPNTKIGNFCILNTNSTIDHDCIMMNFSSIAPGVVTGGKVEIGLRSGIMIGAVVKHGIKIDSDSILGANSFLNKNLSKNTVMYGNPAKFIRFRKKGDSYL